MWVEQQSRSDYRDVHNCYFVHKWISFIKVTSKYNLSDRPHVINDLKWSSQDCLLQTLMDVLSFALKFLRWQVMRTNMNLENDEKWSDRKSSEIRAYWKSEILRFLTWWVESLDIHDDHQISNFIIVLITLCMNHCPRISHETENILCVFLMIVMYMKVDSRAKDYLKLEISRSSHHCVSCGDERCQIELTSLIMCPDRVMIFCM